MQCCFTSLGRRLTGAGERLTVIGIAAGGQLAVVSALFSDLGTGRSLNELENGQDESTRPGVTTCTCYFLCKLIAYLSTISKL